MSAPALAPAASGPAGGPVPGLPGVDSLDRFLLLRFDADGRIRWMNAPARQVLGTAGNVIAALSYGGQDGRIHVVPLGRQWLWMGWWSAEAASSLCEKIRRVNHGLWEAYRRRRRQITGLLGAHTGLTRHSCQAEYLRQLRKTSIDLMGALEGERGRIARELHDNAGQSLAGILLNLELAERHLGVVGSEALTRLARSKELASQALEQIRRISHELDPPEWAEMDLGSAVEWLVDSMGLRNTLNVQIGEMSVRKDLSAAIKTLLYRALQEGLTNVVRHSGASRVQIQLAADEVARLVLEDDGRGFNPSGPRPARGGIGLTSIRRRVEALGGKFELAAAPGQGVRLSLIVPLSQDGL